MIDVLAIITAKPGLRARILEVFAANRATVLAEEGCIAYEAVVDVDADDTGFAKFGADTFVVVEKWATLDAVRAHGAAAHMKAYDQQTRDWVAERAIHVLTPA